MRALLERFGPDVCVTVLEKSTTPGGLARFGIAPDHQSTRRIARTLEAILLDHRVAVAFNVDVGTDVRAGELNEYADAVIWATGATHPRPLGVPGAGLDGVEYAIELVRWYTGHPNGTRPHVLDATRVAVIGNGNVGLDIARILLADPTTLASTEMPTTVQAALSSSSVDEVVVLGRKEPDRAAHSASEVLALAAAEDIGIAVETCAGAAPSGRFLGRAVEAAARPGPANGKRLVLRYGFEPVEVRGHDSVTSLVVRGTCEGELVEIECESVVAAIGTDGGGQIPAGWGSVDGHVLHSEGRVLDDAGNAIPATYVTGWMKRGASGGVGTNKRCAQQTVSTLARDLAAAGPSRDSKSPSAILEELERRGVSYFGSEGWRAVDRAERAEGRASGAFRRPAAREALAIGLGAEGR
ncbi:FAD-dependent oxidoreductase [Rhodococcus olei]|uniref:ferredoxin--NADP(+) reductase n=1 Tax=Rhodococcus olei TaxID=2161675 RepID=A0ABP8NYT5_9NOCA